VASAVGLESDKPREITLGGTATNTARTMSPRVLKTIFTISLRGYSSPFVILVVAPTDERFVGVLR
jgi:hypothetical protein